MTVDLENKAIALAAEIRNELRLIRCINSGTTVKRIDSLAQQIAANTAAIHEINDLVCSIINQLNQIASPHHKAA